MSVESEDYNICIGAECRNRPPGTVVRSVKAMDRKGLWLLIVRGETEFVKDCPGLGVALPQILQEVPLPLTNLPTTTHVAQLLRCSHPGHTLTGWGGRRRSGMFQCERSKASVVVSQKPTPGDCGVDWLNNRRFILA